MSELQKVDAAQTLEAAGVETTSLLESVISETSLPKDEAQSLLDAFVGRLVEPGAKFDRTLDRTLKAMIGRIDEVLSVQVSEILHNERFQKLEGTWRGIKYLVDNTDISVNLKIKLFNAPKADLAKDLENAIDFDQSNLFKKIYQDEFGTPGGQPFGALLGDYFFSKHPEDIETLRRISNVAAAAHCPFISAPAPELMGFKSWEEINKPLDLAMRMDTAEYTKWKSFRESEDSRYVSLVMPRVLARLPWGNATKKADGFDFEEVELGADGQSKPVPHEHYCWMNATYAFGANITRAFSKYGWCVAIRGAEGGGKVENLPVHLYTSEDGETVGKCPTEVLIPETRDFELAKLGFIPLCHYKRTDFAAFISGQTAQKPKEYKGPDGAMATENSAICARLPYIFAVSRASHYLKIMARDKIGSFMEADECQDWLNNWLKDYVCLDEKPTQEMKAKFPFKKAQVEVKEIPGKPGAYNVVAHLQPWLQLEELRTSMRLVARIPQKA